jgi:hypothetical protein
MADPEHIGAPLRCRLTAALPCTTGTTATWGRRSRAIGIGDGQGPHIADHPRTGRGGGLAGRDGDDVGAELGELGQHETMNALAQEVSSTTAAMPTQCPGR